MKHAGQRFLVAATPSPAPAPPFRRGRAGATRAAWATPLRLIIHVAELGDLGVYGFEFGLDLGATGQPQVAAAGDFTSELVNGQSRQKAVTTATLHTLLFARHARSVARMPHAW